MVYTPKYAKGQIVVSFKRNVSCDFAIEFGKGLGYNLSREDSENGETYVFFTPIGMEKLAIEKFRQYSEFVDWADLRDVKIERRWSGLEKAIGKIQNLIDDAEISDKEYTERLNEIVSCLNKSKGLRKK